MALAGRSPRRDGGRRLLAVGIIITIIVVVIDASLKSRSPTVATRLAASAWLDRALPIIQASTTQGRQIEQLRNPAGSSATTAASITGQFSSVATAAQTSYHQLQALSPPISLVGAAGLLEVSLQVRADAAGSMAKDVSAELSQNAVPIVPTTTSTTSGINGATPTTVAASPGITAGQLAIDPQVGNIVAVGRDLSLSDRAYQLFAQRLSSLGDKAPPSAWVSDPAEYGADAVAVFLAALLNATSGQSVHQLTIAAVNLNPAPLRVQGGVEVMVPASAVNVSVIIADTGTERESNLVVQVSINPSAGNAVFQQIVSLGGGAALNVPFGPFNPRAGAVTTLTVTVTPPGSSPTPPVATTVTFTTTVATSTSTSTTRAGAG